MNPIAHSAWSAVNLKSTIVDIWGCAVLDGVWSPGCNNMEHTGFLLFTNVISGPTHQGPIIQFSFRFVAEQTKWIVDTELPLIYIFYFCRVVKGPSKCQIGRICCNLASYSHILLLGNTINLDTSCHKYYSNILGAPFLALIDLNFPWLGMWACHSFCLLNP